MTKERTTAPEPGQQEVTTREPLVIAVADKHLQTAEDAVDGGVQATRRLPQQFRFHRNSSVSTPFDPSSPACHTPRTTTAMNRLLRFSPARLALAYFLLTVLVLALFAIPLWYAWRLNISTFRAYVPGEAVERFVDVFERDGASGLATAMDSQLALARK